jgi:hypothetical protein
LVRRTVSKTAVGKTIGGSIPSASAKMKTCSRCRSQKPLEDFGFRKAGATARRSICKKCVGEKLGEREKRHRAAGLKLDRWICKDAKLTDKRKGLENDIDREFVALMISRPCSYCGGSTIRMTLDRIDNARGHTKDNVVPACIRCNYIRRDMPYAAWLLFAPTLRIIREAGLFGDWDCGPRKNRTGGS